MADRKEINPEHLLITYVPKYRRMFPLLACGFRNNDLAADAVVS